MQKQMPVPKNSWSISTNTALVVIDMQRAFLEKGAPAEVRGGAELVPKINELVAGCRRVNIPVVFVRMVLRPDLSDMGLLRDMLVRDLRNEMEYQEG